MARFAYRAQISTGKTVAGRIDAIDKNAVVDRLLSDGKTPLSVKELQSGEGDWRNWFRQHEAELGPKEVGIFAQDLSRLLSSGFSLHQALEMVSVSSDSKTVQTLASNASSSIAKGRSLSKVLSEERGGAIQALAGLVQAGESSGRLGEILEEASRSFKASAEFREKLTSALIYPVIILFMIVMTLIVFFSFVLPRLRPLFDDLGDRLPLATRLLLSVGTFAENILPIILLVLLIVYISVQALPRVKSRVTLWLHARLLGRLGLGAPRLAGYAAYSRILGLLINAGIPLASANNIASEALRNQALGKSLIKLTNKLRAGESFSAQLSRLQNIPDVMSRMAFLGEQSGKLGPTLIDVAEILERKAQTRTDRMLAMLTPGITIVLGLMVALVVGALFLGITSLTDVDF